VVLHTKVNHGEGKEETSSKQRPCGEENVHIAIKMSSDMPSKELTFSTYGSLTASARQTPAAPADCNDLSAKG